MCLCKSLYGCVCVDVCVGVSCVRVPVFLYVCADVCEIDCVLFVFEFVRVRECL